MSDCSAHRVPRAGLDPIDGAASALTVLQLAIHRPHRPETVVVLLDHERCGAGIAVVNLTLRPDDVLEVIECLSEVAVTTDRIGALVVASVRPGAAHLHELDPDRWFEMCEIAEACGIDVLEWFVIGRHVMVPRDLTGASPKW